MESQQGHRDNRAQREIRENIAIDNSMTNSDRANGVVRESLEEKLDAPCSNVQTDRNNGVVIKNVESESLKSLLVYDSDSSCSSEAEMMSFQWNVQRHLEHSSSSSSSTSSDDDDDEEDDDEDDDDDSVVEVEITHSQSKGAIKKDTQSTRTNGELGIDDLPPVPDLSTLNLNVENEDFVHMGNVLGVVDKLVTVAALPGMPAYDLDTLLFLDGGKKPLGFVFDVLGQVTSPIYAVRFNSTTDIKELDINTGLKVFAAPKSKHTQYVFLQQLLKMKGSDASWKDDSEVPVEFADFSDDENEFFKRSGYKKALTHSKRPHPGIPSDDHKKFETTMNKRNILNTKLNKYMDTYRQSRQKAKASRRSTAPQINTTLPATFDPTVPPPSFQPSMTPYFDFPSGEVGAGGAMRYVPAEYLGMFHNVVGENNNSGSSQPDQGQGYRTSFYNSFVTSLGHTNSANYFTNNVGIDHPGPSH